MGRVVSPGYWRKPDLTAAKFLPDPAGNDVRLYFTGDIGRMAADGCLTYLGRKDFQVKIRGFRVEIAETEAALLDLESVNQIKLIREAVVVARQRHPGGYQQLVAYFVSAVRPAPTSSTLRRLLAERLPDYMVPAVFVPLSAMPLNANAKIDRQALPDLDPTRPRLETAYSVVSQSVPPLTMVQGNPARKVAECGIPLVGNTYEQFVRNLKFVED